MFGIIISKLGSKSNPAEQARAEDSTTVKKADVAAPSPSTATGQAVSAPTAISSAPVEDVNVRDQRRALEKQAAAADVIWIAMEDRIQKLKMEGHWKEALAACGDLPVEITNQLSPGVVTILHERAEKKAAALRAEMPVTAQTPVIAAAPETQLAKAEPAEVKEEKPKAAPTDQELGALINGKPKKHAEEEETVAEASKAEPKELAKSTESNPLFPAKPEKAADAGTTIPAVVPPPALVIAAAPVCPECQGTRFVPLTPPSKYIWVEGEAVPKPDSMVPWKPCPKCNKDFDAAQLIRAETERQPQAGLIKAEWDKVFGGKVARAETPYITVITQNPPAFARGIASSIEKLTTYLQTNTKSTFLTQTRPDTHFLIIAGGDDGWKKLYANYFKDRYPNTREEDFLKTSGTGGRHMQYSHPEPARLLDAQHFTIFQFGHMLMMEATDGKAPAWLEEGFASFCENEIFDKNLCYSFAYERTEVKFMDQWNQEIRNYAIKGQLKTWDRIFPMTLEGLKALDYLTCYSMVAFFIRNEPQRFVKFVELVKEGQDVPKSLEKVYGKKIPELQMMWAQWTTQQK